MTRICLDCPALTTRATRCALCQKMYDAARNHRRPQYAAGWQTTSKKARMAEPWCHCTGCPACTLKSASAECISMDLTLDHEHRRVECRACNSSHRANPGQVG